MDSALTARIGPDHARRLAWFEDHSGQVSPFPAPLEDGLLLATKPKGIYKPADLPYALSIRINLDGPYPDGRIDPRPDGSWSFAYHQENRDPADRDRAYTNQGLMRCIEDQIPVGVLRERPAPHGRRSEYDVLGLARPVSWSSGYFFLESLSPPGSQAGDTVSRVLQATAEYEVEQEDARTPVPRDDYDARLRVYRQIVARQGQPGFRQALLQAYAGRCAVTGCEVEAVLEAAHLRPYRGPESNATVNGLLLRADIHTLFDQQLVAFQPGTRDIVVSRLLHGTQYAGLSSHRLAEPSLTAQRPTREILDTVWQEFAEAEAAR